MKVVLAKSSGFCMGVKRAVDTAKTVYGKDVYILGEIIHNQTVVSDIKKLGTTIIEDVEEIDKGTLIIRSHGVGKSVLKRIEEKGLNVINCTCPFVMKTQKIIEEYYEKGYKIVITGENHAKLPNFRVKNWYECYVVIKLYRFHIGILAKVPKNQYTGRVDFVDEI
jgi:4-hydroxy-3-methylbut-2-enyl diphosphate reductase